MRRSAALILLLLACACSGGSTSTAAPDASSPAAGTATEPTTDEAAVDEVPSEEARVEEPSEAPSFPPGYPKIVAVSSLPSQVRNWYEDQYTKAVAIAPGVWTPLSPGAEMEDAIASGVLDGFCASKKAYERKYTPGEEHGGACW